LNAFVAREYGSVNAADVSGTDNADFDFSH
jgi:hypothetical protein